MHRHPSRLISFLAIVILLVGCTAYRPGGWQTRPSSAPTTPPDTAAATHMAGMPMPSTTPAQAATAAGEPIAIEAFDLGFKPASITVAAAGTYPVTFANTGSTTHDVTFADGTKLTAEAGKTVTGSVTVPAGGITFLCAIPGHAAAGMTGSVSVGDGMAMGDPAASPAAPSTPAAAAGAPVADPNAPKYVRRDPVAPRVLPGTVHDIDLPIIDQDMTVADGFVVKVWTFGGTVPAPTIRVHLGDTGRVHLTNKTQMSHSIDFHASQTAMNDQMVEIKPGGTFIYTFTADYAGVWMYHCGTAPALHHIANGMFGMLIVEPKGGLPKVDQEFAFVQNEWYLGAQDQPVDYTKASAGAPSPDFVAFNGIANQYKDTPIDVKTKGRIRMFVLDAGPNIDSSFHVVGTIFDTVTKEGITLARGNAQGWGSQAVDLSPAQGAIIEFSPVEDGMYPFVTHAFNFVGRGAIGIFSAGDGDPSN
jgi:nitrite reductase (NO-forming)